MTGWMILMSVMLLCIVILLAVTLVVMALQHRERIEYQNRINDRLRDIHELLITQRES